MKVELKLLLLTAKSKLDHTNFKNDSFYDMNSKAFSRVFFTEIGEIFPKYKIFYMPRNRTRDLMTGRLTRILYAITPYYLFILN